MEKLNFAEYPPAYKAAAENLVSHLLKEQKFEEQRKIFENFSKHYSVVPILLKEWVDTVHANSTSAALLGGFDVNCYRTMNKLYHESIKHFINDAQIFEKYPNDFNRPYRKLLTFLDFDLIECRIDISRLRHVVLLEQILVIPHSKLNEALELYKRRCDTPLNAAFLKRHENAKKMYEKIQHSKTQNELFNLLLETKDDDFIVDNIEHQLSQNPGDKKIWIFYFDYLKNQCDIKILDLYRRYCRLFIEDASIRKIYAKTIEYFLREGYNIEFWLNDLKAFVEYFGAADEINYLQQLFHDIPSTKNVIKQEKITSNGSDVTLFGEEIIYKKCKTFFNPINFLIQEFSFPKTIMNYIKNNSIKTYRKLIQTCKHFFIKKQVVPVWHLDAKFSVIADHFHQNSMYLGHSTYLKYQNVHHKHIIETKPQMFLNKKIWLEHSVCIIDEFKFLNKIYQCDIQFLRLLSVDLTFSEYEMLVKSERIEEIELYGGRILTEKGKEDEVEDLFLEDLMKWLPNANKMFVLL